MKLALLLALIMPLQGFASAWGCGSFDTAPASAPDTALATAPQHCAHEVGVAQQHHHCGICCCAAAIAVMPLFRVPPRPANPGALLPVRSPPAIVLDRLDRPPRLA
jgi:hypothetical protein